MSFLSALESVASYIGFMFGAPSISSPLDAPLAGGSLSISEWLGRDASDGHVEDDDDAFRSNFQFGPFDEEKIAHDFSDVCQDMSRARLIYDTSYAAHFQDDS